jgi:hypothetical protein
MQDKLPAGRSTPPFYGKEKIIDPADSRFHRVAGISWSHIMGVPIKKSMLVVLTVLSLALFPLTGNVYADSDDFRSYVLTNELGTGA